MDTSAADPFRNLNWNDRFAGNRISSMTGRFWPIAVVYATFTAGKRSLSPSRDT